MHSPKFPLRLLAPVLVLSVLALSTAACQAPSADDEVASGDNAITIGCWDSSKTASTIELLPNGTRRDGNTSLPSDEVSFRFCVDGCTPLGGGHVYTRADFVNPDYAACKVPRMTRYLPYLSRQVQQLTWRKIKAPEYDESCSDAMEISACLDAIAAGQGRDASAK